MSLGSIVNTVETDIKDGVQNAITWLTEVAETHLPAVSADIKAVASSPVFRAIEAALLTPSEEALVAELVAKLPSLRQPAASADAPAETPAAGVPAEGDQSAA